MHTWTIEQLSNALDGMAQTLIQAKDLLNDKDRGLGDGDHGTTVARGFTAVRDALKDQTFTTLQEVFKTVGMTLMRSMGGASGVLFGTFFLAGSKIEGTAFDPEYFCQWLALGMNDLQKRGGAKPGDKTMLDALAPALNKAQAAAAQEASLDDVMTEAAQGAQGGVEATKSMIAKKGRAHTLGEKTLGHEDAGAVSIMLALQELARAFQTFS
jgi:dihydroxyacetone kinase phosphoprotein-dependent L subunit